jgi:hypothetical protein
VWCEGDCGAKGSTWSGLHRSMGRGERLPTQPDRSTRAGHAPSASATQTSGRTPWTPREEEAWRRPSSGSPHETRSFRPPPRRGSLLEWVLHVEAASSTFPGCAEEMHASLSLRGSSESKVWPGALPSLHCTGLLSCLYTCPSCVFSLPTYLPTYPPMQI